MNLTYKQRKRLKRSLRELPLTTVAQSMGLTADELKEYVKKTWSAEATQLLTGVPSKDSHTSELKLETGNFSLKQFLISSRFYFIFLFFLVIVAYVNSFGNQFLSDDMDAIVNNRDLGSYGWAFRNWISSPRLLLYVTTFKLFGLNPFFFRLINIFFHLGSVFMVFILVSYLTKKKEIGFLSASIFAVHPILIEGVTWVSGGPYSQFTFFLLLSLFFYVYAKGSIKYYIFSLIACILGFLTSEKSIMFPGILILASFTFSSLKRDWKKLIPFGIIGVLYIAVNLLRIQQRVEILTTKNYTNAGLQNPLMNIPVAISSYLGLIFWPDKLTFYHSELNFSYGQFSIFVLVTLLYLGLTVYFYFKNRSIFFWLTFFLIAISPTITPFGISWVVAERYVYMGSVGIIVIIAYALHRLTGQKKTEIVGYLIFAFILVGLTARTIVRNLDWRTMDHLSIATARTSPSDPKTHNNMGDVYAKRGEFEKAAESFSYATKLNPRYADAYHNLANTYKDMGQYELAIQNYNKALEINPDIWQTYQGLGVVYYQQKDIPKAVEYMQKALEINPHESSMRTNLGIMYLQAGQKELALEQFTEALKLDSSNQKAALGIQEVNK